MPTALTQPESPFIGPREWEFSQTLIRDLEQDERRQQLAPLLMAVGQWRAAIKTFRRTEMRRMYERQPEEVDLRFHRMLVSHLISTGESLALAVTNVFPGEQRDRMGLKTGDIDAMVAALRDTYHEWHALTDPARLEELEARIFTNGPA